MTESRWSGFNINLGDKTDREARPAGNDEPFRILLIGDFSGRQERGLFETGRSLAARRPLKIDPEGLDQAIEKLRPSVSIPELSMSLEFRELDDFHPDQIFRRTPRLQDLKDADENEIERASARRPSSGFLDQIMEGNFDIETPQAAPVVETAQSALRKILHNPSFRKVETAWRSVDFLLRRLVLDGELALFILDVSRKELEQDVLETEDLEKTGLFGFLVTRTIGTPGQVPWALVTLVEPLSSSARDAELAARLAMISSIAKTTVLAGASSRLVGCSSFGKSPDPEDWTDFPASEDKAMWNGIRALPEARYLGIALPRILLRTPYGDDSDVIDSFDFEELDSPHAHEDLLWGTGALAPALLLGEAFLEDGWGFRPGSRPEIEGLPYFTVEDDGETLGVPCAEAYFTLTAAERILDAGCMPLISIKNTDTVRLARVQSFASPLADLAGRWRG